MAENQAKADAVVADLRSKGYSVRTSATSKGVRVLVGSGNSREDAVATKRKLEQDKTAKVNSAWVINWQPADS